MRKTELDILEIQKADDGLRPLDTIVSGRLPNGKYETANGSILKISGKHNGIARVDFDWLEEGGCIDCECEPYPEEFDKGDWRIIWNCEHCDGGNAKLQPAS